MYEFKNIFERVSGGTVHTFQQTFSRFSHVILLFFQTVKAYNNSELNS